jgi:serine/threonine protein kinase
VKFADENSRRTAFPRSSGLVCGSPYPLFAERGVDAGTRKEVEALVAFDSGGATCLAENIGQIAQQALSRFERNDIQCDPYRLRDLLGRGGMGTVYLAERVNGEIAQRVAVKLLRHGTDDPPLRQRFLAERQILATLSHPNIARLLDAGQRRWPAISCDGIRPRKNPSMFSLLRSAYGRKSHCLLKSALRSVTSTEPGGTS